MQRAALQYLKDSDTFIVFKSDKNLDHERSEYINRALNEHLRTETYRQLSEPAALGRINAMNKILCRFIDKYTQPRSWDRKFLERSLQVSDPFSYYYSPLENPQSVPGRRDPLSPLAAVSYTASDAGLTTTSNSSASDHPTSIVVLR